MSRAAFPTKSVGPASGPKPAVSRSSKQKPGNAKPGDTTDISNTKAPKISVPNAVRSVIRSRSADNLKLVSRVELLLAPKLPQPVYKTGEETASTRATNIAIKSAGQWTDVRTIILEAKELSASNIGFALYRLGCLYSFASRFRKTEISSSGIVQLLLKEVQARLHELDAGSITLVLDGCARLEQRLEAKLMNSLANLVHALALSFEASQLPLVLWAFERFHFVPRDSILAALDNAVDRLAGGMSPQGIALTLHGFQACRFKPSLRALNRLAGAMQRQLAYTKPSEAAASITAFSAFNYTPQPELLAAVARISGHSVHSNTVTGKPSLSRSASEQSADSLAEARVNLVEQGSKAAATQLAAAGRMLRSVGQKVDVAFDVSTTSSRNRSNTPVLL